MIAPALFPPPDPDIPRLSTRFLTFRRIPGDKVKWARKAPRARADCDECAALQHETQGRYWPRRQVRARRTVNGGHPLDLCGAHAQAWKDRDRADDEGGQT
jgi:hypothetical protein